MKTLSSSLLLVLAACAASSREQETPAPAPAQPAADVRAPEAPANPALAVWERVRARYDADRDASITRAEYPRGDLAFARLDADADGSVTATDFAEEWNERPREKLVWGEGGPEVGDEAPNFRLESTSGEAIELASFRGKSAVALVFGSFT